MIKELTKNRMDNIIIYRILMDNWHMDTFDYIEEKYNILFNELPDLINVNWSQSGSTIDDVIRYKFPMWENVYSTYIMRWNQMKELSEDQIKIMTFTFMLKELDVFSFVKILDVFKLSFKSFNVVNNKNNTIMLHGNWRGHVDEFYDKNKILARILKLRKINEKILNK